MTVGAILLVGALGVVLGRQWPSVSTPSTTTTVTTPPPTAQPVSAIWPFASTVTRFDSPILAAQAFATAYLGIVDPIMGVYQQGDARSGEVPVRATSHGVITTILVRELTSSHSWWVIGASCPDINLTTPASSSRISSPVLLKGRSIAFEAVVNVELRQDGTLAPLKRDTVRGGSGVIGPFIRSMTFPSPTSLRGALLLRTLSAKDGHVVEASVVRIAFLK
jgi:hypothetical protein